MRVAFNLAVAAASITSIASADAALEVKKGKQCCRALAEIPALRNKVYYPDSTIYDARIESYWSESAALEPWCMVLPTTTNDTSEVMKVISTHECPFGIRGGGHTVFPLSSSVEDGVTVDFGRMNSTTYDPEDNIASIEPGGNWGATYDALAPHGVVVPGGRGSAVGISGFILGGGYSFFTHAHGFACDTVKNFEVVLADGSVVNANAEENRDLWVSLKGGSGNFGLVTRFDMDAIPYAEPENPVIWGGGLFWDVNATYEVIETLAEFGDNAADDVSSTSFCMFLWAPQVGWQTACSLNNIINRPSAPAFDGYMAIGGVTNSTLRSDSMLNLTKEQDAVPGFRNIWFTGAFKNDPRIMHFAFERQKEVVQRFKEEIPDENQNVVIQFHPVTPSMVSRGKGLNSFGLDENVADGAGVISNLLLQMDSPESEAKAYKIATEYQDAVDEYAASLGADWDFRYLNYADFSVDPIERYGKESVERMRDVSAKYDPQGVFQKLRKSGHKIPME
ncbi:hypothetical protein FQN54_009821 [Arachnomyces sp. PD_36]|nr:hypothetical protein FQN54_009821 [Arachnomyces sp. PD_36]